MRRLLQSFVLFVALAILPAATWARESLTPRSSVAELDQLKSTYEVPEFRIGGSYDLARPETWANGAEGGATLESLGAGPLKTAYIAVGTPHKNAEGKIDNAILISSFYSGDATAMYNNWYEGQAGNGFSGGALVGPGLLFDTNRYYVVFVDGLGLWGASKPSDGLGIKFPHYSYFDMVQANYRLLTDKLNIGHVVLATGVSMGATQAYVWGLMHPEFVGAVMPIGGATATDGAAPIAAWAFQLAKAGLESDPVWVKTKGDYYDLPKDQHPRQGPAFHWSMLQLTGYELGYRQSQGWDRVKGSVFAWEPPEEGFGADVARLGAQFDAVDLKYRVEVGEKHNINAYLKDYKPRTLILHIENDNWLTVDKARESADLIQGAEIVTEKSPIAHYATFSLLNSLKSHPTVESFLAEIGLIEDAGKVCDAPHYTSPRINMNPDPATSFWLDNMVPPFPVKFETVTDDRGVEWQIGYMDEVCPGLKDPKTLVIVHGKGAFGAHYGYLMRYAVEHGYRVITPDMPHYGVSGPGNLHQSPARTFDDIRAAFHELLVEKLGAPKAYYLGHSMGGQFALGYALKYPDAVAGLILEGPAGLEQFPKTMKIDGQELPVFDPSYAHDFAKWEKIWEPTGTLKAEFNRTAQEVRDFFHFKSRDPETGATSPSPFGYFINDTEFAQLHTNQRVAMITGNPEEFKQWVIAFIYDIYTIGSENVEGDPNNLYHRLPQIKAPIFLAFGAKEPFIPSTSLNGLTDMANQVITPFLDSMRAAGRDVETKLYPNVAHFIHTDTPLQFSRDTVDFMNTGRVNPMSRTVVDALVNGVAAAGGPAASGGEVQQGFSK